MAYVVRILSFGAALLVGVTALLATPAAADAAIITNKDWGGNLCLDADARIAGRVQLYGCHSGPNQQWEFGRDGTLRNVWTSTCLEADPGTKDKVPGPGGARLNACASPPPPQLRWFRDALTLELRSALDTHQCLDANAHDGGNGTLVQMWDCWGWENAKWLLTPEYECTGEPGAPVCGPLQAPQPAPAPAPPTTPSPTDACAPPVAAGAEFALRARVRPSKARRSRSRGRRVITVGYRRPVRVTGRLTRADGTPVAGAELCIAAQTAVAGASREGRGRITTGADGRFSYKLKSRASQQLWFVYRAGAAAVAASVRVQVRAPLSLRTTRRRFRPGETMTLKGRLRARPRTRGALVLLQARRPERWQTFGNARLGRNGRFRYDYRFTRPSGRVQLYKLRARMPEQHGSPYATSTSPVLRVFLYSR